MYPALSGIVPRVTDLFERTWPAADAKAAVVIVHGLGEHVGRYDHVAQALNGAGYAVYAQDVRGHGQSVGFPGDMGGDADQLVNDVVEHTMRVKSAHDRVFLLAHSMGTLLTLPAVPKLQVGTIEGLVLSGNALEPGEAAADLITNGAVPPETISNDPAVVQAYIDDPLVWDAVPPEVLLSTVDIGQRARDAVPLIEVPVLLVHGLDDKLCDVAGAQYIHTELKITDKTFIPYEGMRHEVFNEVDKQRVITDVIRWLDAH